MMVSISQMERGEKIAPVSPHQLINHFANVFVKSHAAWISNRFAINMFVINFVTTFFCIPVCLSVPPPPPPTDDHQSITAKLEISAKFWLPPKSQFRGCDLSGKQNSWMTMEFSRGGKMLNGAVSVACRG